MIKRGGAPRSYDLANRRDRALMHEQVLTEGTDDAVRYFIVIDDLVELWQDQRRRTVANATARFTSATCSTWIRKPTRAWPAQASPVRPDTDV
jgi:hypothetical protein